MKSKIKIENTTVTPLSKKAMRDFKMQRAFRQVMDRGQNIGHAVKRLRVGLMVSAFTLLILGILVFTTSCVSGESKKAVNDITFSNSIIKELTSYREYKSKWFGQIMEEPGILVAGIVEITFAEPFYVDRQWPSYERNVNDFNEKGPGYSWKIDQPGEKTYEVKDYDNKKIYVYDFNKTIHYAKLVKKVLVFVYFTDENCVVINPLDEGEVAVD